MGSSGPKGATRLLSRPDRPKGKAEGAGDVSGGHSGPAWGRRLRDESDRRVGLDLSDARLARTHPSRLKYLDRVNFYGQEGELDNQGRVVIPPHLRESASIIGEVRVFGRINHIEVWNADRFAQKLQRESWTEEDALRLSEHGI